MKLTTKQLKEMIKEELSEAGFHPGIHEEIAIREVIILMVQAATKMLEDKKPGLITTEQMPELMSALMGATASIIEEFTGPPGSTPHGRGENEQGDPSTKYRG